MARDNSEEVHDAFVMSRRVMDYVKWKHRAQSSKQLMVTSAIFFAATVIGILIFVLFISGVIPSGNGANSSQVSIKKEYAGLTKDGTPVERFTFTNKKTNFTLQVTQLGCTITSVSVPDRTGRVDNVIVGHGPSSDVDNFNSIIGRVAGRFGQNIVFRDGMEITPEVNLTNNEDWNQLVWNASQGTDGVTFSHQSPDGDQNYPGEILVNVSYQLTEDNEIRITHTAEAITKPSPINLSNRFCFNLAGKENASLLDTKITVYSDYYLSLSDETDKANMVDVNNTMYDLRKLTPLSDILVSPFYWLRGPPGKRLAMRTHHPGSGRMLTVYTDQPGLHVYADDTPAGYTGLCVQTQSYPKAIDHPLFPDDVLYPGSTYIQTTWYKFDVAE